MNGPETGPNSDAESGAQGAPMTSDPPAMGGAASGATGSGQEATTEHPEPITRPAASGAGVSLVQPGWHVIARDGEDLGRVTRIEADRLIIARDGLTTPDELTIPRDHVGAEDEGMMRVYLSTDEAAADLFASGAS